MFQAFYIRDLFRSSHPCGEGFLVPHFKRSETGVGKLSHLPKFTLQVNGRTRIRTHAFLVRKATLTLTLPGRRETGKRVWELHAGSLIGP